MHYLCTSKQLLPTTNVHAAQLFSRAPLLPSSPWGVTLQKNWNYKLPTTYYMQTTQLICIRYWKYNSTIYNIYIQVTRRYHIHAIIMNVHVCDCCLCRRGRTPLSFNLGWIERSLTLMKRLSFFTIPGCFAYKYKSLVDVKDASLRNDEKLVVNTSGLKRKHQVLEYEAYARTLQV